MVDCGNATAAALIACGTVFGALLATLVGRGRAEGGGKGKGQGGAGGAWRGEQKMLLVVRMDLKMGKGKIAAQCSHAAVGAVRQASSARLEGWARRGEAKVVVKAETEAELMAVRDAAKRRGVPTYIVVDAGRTQIAAGSRTVLALGPAPVDQVDAVAKHLKLL